jgi:transposase
VILVPRSVRVYFATAPMNLRMSFEGLSNAVREVLRQDPLAGHVFVFLNRRKTMVKLLVYTRGGYTIIHKRLLCAAPHKSRYAKPVVMRSDSLKAGMRSANRV